MIDEPTGDEQHPPMEPGAPLPQEPGGDHGAGGLRLPTLLAWIVILAAVGYYAFDANVGGDDAGPRNADDPVGDLLMRVQGRYIVGAAQSPLAAGPLLYAQSEPFNTGSLGQRMRFVVLAAELAGREEAGRRLVALRTLVADEIDESRASASPFEPTAEQAEILRTLGRLYPPDVEVHGADWSPTPPEDLDEQERTRLEKGLGWFGALALAPQDGADEAARAEVMATATRTFTALIGAFAGAGVVAVAGFAGLVVMVILAALRKLRNGIRTGSAHHGVYAETFAIWMIVFTLCQRGGGKFAQHVAPDHQFAVIFVAFLASLVALLWPVLRGITWRRVREDIGWTAGRTPAVEPLLGAGGYAMALPLLAVGVLLTLLFKTVAEALAAPALPFTPGGGPAHPIVSELGQGSAWAFLQILAVGAIAAPIVEETMFRGVLYRHLRESAAGLGVVVSVLVATLVNAFVFAVIHPQGWIAIPALMSLAIAFTLMREWRGTLIGSMLMHGISNALVLGLFRMLAML